MNVIKLPLSELHSNPWQFKMMSDADFNSLVKTLDKHGMDYISPIMIAKIGKKLFVVDGHARLLAVQKLGYGEIHCNILSDIRCYSDLRHWSFKINRHGFSDPLLLSDMFAEDFNMLGNVESVAKNYGITSDYVENMLKINDLSDNSKIFVKKIISIAQKKYQFILEQITPAHLSFLSELEPEKQESILQWIFHDILYGPPAETLLSIPSIYSILEEIDHVSQKIPKKRYKLNPKSKQIQKDIELRCRCGQHFSLDVVTQKIYEFYEHKELILKQEYQPSMDHVRRYSSEEYSKKQIKTAIDHAKNSEILLSIVEHSDDFK